MDIEYISTPYDASMNLPVANPSTPATMTIPFNSISEGNSTTLSNSAVGSFPFTNLTMSSHFSPNSSIENSTLTNSTFFNSTILNYSAPKPLPINSTKWNTLSIGNHARNHTKPVAFNKGSSPVYVPGYGSSTDTYIKPAIQNSIFKNSGVLNRLSAGSLLIPLLVFLRLIANYL